MPQTGNNEDNIRSYFIVFTDEARLGWFYRLFTRKGFRHCEVIMTIGDGSMGFQHNLENIEINFYKENVFQTLEKLEKRGCTILYLQVEKKPRSIKSGIMIPSCVGTSQILTGVSFHAISPYGYYKALLRYGAKKYRNGKWDH